MTCIQSSAAAVKHPASVPHYIPKVMLCESRVCNTTDRQHSTAQHRECIHEACLRYVKESFTHVHIFSCSFHTRTTNLANTCATFVFYVCMCLCAHTHSHECMRKCRHSSADKSCINICCAPFITIHLISNTQDSRAPKCTHGGEGGCMCR
jgi:hypothetical protein